MKSSLTAPSKLPPPLRALWLAHLALLGVACLYAGNYFVAKYVFAALRPTGAVGLRTAGSFLLFWLLWKIWVRERISSRQDRLRLLLCALFGTILNQNLFFLGLDQTTPVHASVIMTTGPLFVFLFARVARSEALTPRKLLGLALAFGGALWLSVQGKSLNADGQTIWGNLMVMGNAASYGLYLVLVTPLMQRYHVFTIMTWIFGIGTLVNLPLALPDILAVDWAHFPGMAGAGLAYIIVGVTVMTFGFNAYALQRVPTSQVGIYIYLQPVLVSVLAAFLPNNQVTVMQLLCMLAVLAGVSLVTYRKKKK